MVETNQHKTVIVEVMYFIEEKNFNCQIRHFRFIGIPKWLYINLYIICSKWWAFFSTQAKHWKFRNEAGCIIESYTLTYTNLSFGLCPSHLIVHPIASVIKNWNKKENVKKSFHSLSILYLTRKRMQRSLVLILVIDGTNGVIHDLVGTNGVILFPGVLHTFVSFSLLNVQFQSLDIFTSHIKEDYVIRK